jgi:hypothetical protein
VDLALRRRGLAALVAPHVNTRIMNASPEILGRVRKGHEQVVLVIDQAGCTTAKG